MRLRKLLETMKTSNYIAYLEALDELNKYDLLLKRAQYLCYLGKAKRPSRDFDRAVDRGRTELEDAMVDIVLGTNTATTMPSDQREADLALARQVAVRTAWLCRRDIQEEN
jgi:hypothetical protein